MPWIHGCDTVSATVRVILRKSYTRLALLAVLVLSVPAATHTALAQQTPQELTVNFLSQGEPDSLDPHRTRFAAAGEAAVIRQVFEPLLRFDEKLNPQPAAAESFDVSPDGTVITFHLR